MEYEFSRDPVRGGYHAKFSMEHEIFSAWLVDEVGNDQHCIQQIFAKVEQARGHKNIDLTIQGREYLLVLNDLDVVLQLNSDCEGVGGVSSFGDEYLPDDSVNVNSDLARAECGLDDFSQMLTSWQDFLQQ